MTSIYFIPWTPAVGSIETLALQASGRQLLIESPSPPTTPFSPPPWGLSAHSSPASQGPGHRSAPEDRREARRRARGIGGQREISQENRGLGLSGEPKVTFTGLWIIEPVSLAELPVMAMSLQRAK